jgi:hypothetical protein
MSARQIVRGAVLVLVLAGTIAPGSATTLFSDTVASPVGDGECAVVNIGSYGSYIYGWPSKYDAVFWPHTEPNWLFTCAESGYVSWGSDFDELTDEERTRIAAHLAGLSSRSLADAGFAERLDRAEALYRLRDKNEWFWAFFYRLRAYHADEPADAAEYRERALDILERLLPTLPPGVEKIEALYLVGEYRRRAGDDEGALKAFGAANNVRWTTDEGDEMVGHPHYRELTEDRANLIRPTVNPDQARVRGLGLGDPVAEALALFGEPDSTRNWGGDERQGEHEFEDAKVTFADGRIVALRCRGECCKTDDGIVVGDPVGYVRGLLGPNELIERREGKLLRYGIGGEERYLIFRVESGRIAGIILRETYR